MNSLADLKRALTVGATVEVTEHVHAHLKGTRTVVVAQTKQVCLSFPEGHPKVEHRGSWLTLPKRADVAFDGDTVVITQEGHPLLTMTVKA